MSKKSAHLEATDSHFHIYNRGVDANTVFYTPIDYEDFILRLAGCLKRHDVAVSGYTLMPNHFHMIALQREAYAFSEFLREVCGNYAAALNKRNGRKGHLFGSRFKIKPIRDEGGLLVVSRYIHLNPVRAGLVARPEDWKYSSCQEYIGLVPGFVNKADIYALVNGPEGYRDFLNEYDAAFPGQIADFIERHRKK